MLIDSHVNLHAPQFDEDREAVIDARAGRRRRPDGQHLRQGLELRGGRAPSPTHAGHLVHGRHPSARGQGKSGPCAPRPWSTWRRDPRVVGIGETGLDFHYDLSPRDIQAQVFRAHVAAARETGLPLVVHTREADEVMGDILEEEHASGPFRS